MNKIIDHEHPGYRRKWRTCGAAKYNGAFFYSKEIVKNIIPEINTDRNWITVNVKGIGFDHAIVFIHNNTHPENYNWLAKYQDLVFVCGIPETMKKVEHLGKVIYLPLSVDVEDVKRYYQEEKTRGACFAGRAAKRRKVNLPPKIEYLEGMPRTRFLKKLAEYKEVYAVGRTAIEAKILGAEVKPYDPRFPDTDRWQILDNKDAAKILQKELDRIDGKRKASKEKDTAPGAAKEKQPDLEAMTKAKLAEYAEEHGIQINKRARKAEIIEAIKA